jgi:trichohyalin
MLELEIVHRREEEQRMKTEQERARAAEAQRRLVEDMRRRDAEAAKRLEEERGKTEVEKKRIEEEYRQKALQEKARLEEEAQRRLNEEKQRLEEEARKRAEQDARVKLEEEKRRLEEENRRRIAEEQRAKHEEEQRREAAAAEERKRAEAESRRKEDDAARLRVEQELRKRLEEEKQRKQEEEQVLAAAREEGKRQAVETKAAEFLAAARQHFAQKAYDKTLVETAKIKSIDPAHAGAAEIEASVRKAQSDLLAAQVESARKIPRETLAAMYVRSLREGMSDGLLTTEENLILLEWRGVLGIGEEDHKKLELKAKLDIYADALRESWQGGSISRAAADHLEQMRADLQITTEQHLSVEQQVRKGS